MNYIVISFHIDGCLSSSVAVVLRWTSWNTVRWQVFVCISFYIITMSHKLKQWLVILKLQEHYVLNISQKCMKHVNFSVWMPFLIQLIYTDNYNKALTAHNWQNEKKTGFLIRHWNKYHMVEAVGLLISSYT